MTRLFTIFCVAFISHTITFTSQASPQVVTKTSNSRSKESAKDVAKEKEKVILFIGDSLTDGYGVKKEEAYPQKVGEILKEKGHAVKIINGGISGSVTAEADRRLKWFLKSKPDILVLALGANDALKGTPADVVKKNLAIAIDLAKNSDVKVLLAGMRIYSNYGSDYGKAFESLYKDLAKEKKVELMPFLLEGVAMKPDLNQADARHPNAKGHEVIAKAVVAELEKML